MAISSAIAICGYAVDVGVQMHSNLINIDGVGDSIVETEVDLSFRYSRAATTVIPEVRLAPWRCEHLFHKSSLQPLPFV